MVQGQKYGKKLSKGKKTKPNYSHKRSSKKFTKKGNPTVEIRRGASSFKRCGSKSVTGAINRNIEEIMSSRVLQSGSSLVMKDVKAVGKERLKEINRASHKKKKSRLEQKLEEQRERVEAMNGEAMPL